MQKMKAALQHTLERVKHDTIPSCGVCAGVPSQAVPPKPPRVLPSGPPEQLQVQRVIQRMQKKDPYKIFAEIPSDEMVRPLDLPHHHSYFIFAPSVSAYHSLGPGI